MLNYPLDPLYWQRFLNCLGAGLVLDGFWGLKSQTAARIFEAKSAAIAADIGPVFDPRSEANIQTLHYNAQIACRAFMAKAVQELKSSPYSVRVTSGTRTYREQNDLYGQHPKVTNAQGGESNHNFGYAWDVTVFQGNDPVYEHPLYITMGGIGKALGLTWGGDWISIQDQPHFQIIGNSNEVLRAVKAMFEKGLSYFKVALLTEHES